MRFKDVFSIIGPAMLGPSSSHTAGAVRIGRIARQIFGDNTPERAEVIFYGSFAETYLGHGTDLAIAAGLLGYDTDHLRIPLSLEDAKAAGLDIQFKQGKNQMYHPNTAKVLLTSADQELTVIGSSIGGGNVEMVSINDFDVKFTGVYPTLILFHQDHPGIIADVTGLLRQYNVNIGCMDVDRKARSGDAMTVLELDSPISEEWLQALQNIKGVQDIRTVDLTERGSV